MNLGLTAAREVWYNALPEVRVEVTHLSIRQGDEETAYDLSVVLPRATVEQGIARAVARHERAAR